MHRTHAYHTLIYSSAREVNGKDDQLRTKYNTEYKAHCVRATSRRRHAPGIAPPMPSSMLYWTKALQKLNLWVVNSKNSSNQVMSNLNSFSKISTLRVEASTHQRYKGRVSLSLKSYWSSAWKGLTNSSYLLPKGPVFDMLSFRTTYWMISAAYKAKWESVVVLNTLQKREILLRTAAELFSLPVTDKIT